MMESGWKKQAMLIKFSQSNNSNVKRSPGQGKLRDQKASFREARARSFRIKSSFAFGAGATHYKGL